MVEEKKIKNDEAIEIDALPENRDWIKYISENQAVRKRMVSGPKSRCKECKKILPEGYPMGLKCPHCGESWIYLEEYEEEEQE